MVSKSWNALLCVTADENLSFTPWGVYKTIENWNKCMLECESMVLGNHKSTKNSKKQCLLAMLGIVGFSWISQKKVGMYISAVTQFNKYLLPIFGIFKKTFFSFSSKFNDKENLQLINDFPAQLFIGNRNSKAQEFIVTFYSILLKIIWSLFLDELKWIFMM